jgi:hypothetical protein
MLVGVTARKKTTDFDVEGLLALHYVECRSGSRSGRRERREG